LQKTFKEEKYLRKQVEKELSARKQVEKVFFLTQVVLIFSVCLLSLLTRIISLVLKKVEVVWVFNLLNVLGYYR